MYEDVDIPPGMVYKFTEENFAGYFKTVKEMAYELPVQAPLTRLSLIITLCITEKLSPQKTLPMLYQ